MNAASLETLRLAAELLDTTGCSDTEARQRVRTTIQQNDWSVLRRTYNARERAPDPPAPLPSPRPVATHRAGTETPINGTRTQCEVCRLYFNGAGNDCFSFEAPHAPGVVMVVCAPCVFSEFCRTEPPGSFAHEVARVYYK